MSHSDPSESTRFRDLLPRLPMQLRKLLRCAAFQIKPVKYETLTSMAYSQNITERDFPKILQEWLDSGILSPEFKGVRLTKNNLRLHPHLHALLLLELVNETPSDWQEYLEFQDQNIDVWGHQVVLLWIEETRSAIFDYLIYGLTPKFRSFNTLYNQSDYLAPLASAWPDFPELIKMSCFLPEQMLGELFAERFDRLTLHFEPDTSEKLKSFTSENEALDLYERSYYANLLLIPEFILKGRYEAIPQLASAQVRSGMAALGLYAYHHGSFEEAANLFERAIKEKRGSNFVGFILYDFAFIVALMRVDTPKNKTRLTALYKKKELKESGEYGRVLSLLLRIALFDIDIARTTLEEVPETPLYKLLYLRVIKHFSLRPLDAEELETMARYATFPEIELPPYLHRELWERTLDLLLGTKNGDAQQKESAPTPSASRVTYLINEFGDVIPRLQKSKDGKTWSKGRNIALLTFKEGVEGMSALDKEVAGRVRITRGNNYRGYPTDEVTLGGADTIALLAGHPQVYSEENPLLPITISIEKPYLSVFRKENRFEMESNVDPLQLRKAAQCVFETDCRIKVIRLTPKQQEILTALLKVGHFPLAAEERLKNLIQTIAPDLIVHSDLIASDQEVIQTEGDASVTIQLLPVGDGFKAEFFIKPFGDTPPYCKAGTGPKTAMGKRGGITCQATRDLALEKRNLQEVRSYFGEFDFTEEDLISLPSPLECLEFLELVQTLPEEQVRVEWPEGVRLKIRNQATVNNFSLSLKGKRGWFEMVGSLQYGNEKALTLGELLNQIDEGDTRRFIALGDHEYIALSEELRKILHTIKSLSLKDKKGNTEISAFTAPLLRDLKDSGVDFTHDLTYKKLLKRIDEASQKRYEVSPKLQAELRPYQEEGFRWMARLSDWGSGACLADDMGLGKTVQTIALLLHKAPGGPSLVVAPASVLPNWEQELLRFAPALSCKVLNAGTDRKTLIESAEHFDVVLTTYGLLVSEAELLEKKKWNVIVLDEAHTIKNKETKMSKAAMTLQGDFRLLLTGTPVQNHLSEIWNLFQFMNPGMLGSFEQFNASYIVPIEVAHDEARHKALKKQLRPFILRRTKSEVLTELPGKTEILIPVTLNKEEETYYEYLRKRAADRLKSDRTNTIQSLAEITRLRQAASNIALVKSEFDPESSKMKAFFELFEGMRENNHRALVFSQFTSHLAFFCDALKRRGIDFLYLDGATPTAERGRLVKQFQTGDQPLFLISLKAGGLGLNLTAADFIVHLDPWWNPAIEDQASDRAYRIGQTRPVTVYRLIAINTIEEKIIRLHHSKKDLADSLLEGTNSSHKLTREELLELLK
ncbi:MAG: DEAD/DEAH box helicase [Bacteroidales bacterium]